MTPIEIIIMLAAIGIVVAVVGRYIYKRVTKKPVGECSHCHMDMKRALKKVAKEYKRERNQKCNCS